MVPCSKRLVLMQVGWQRRLWLLCEEPASSLAARVFAVVSIICIMTSIVNFCLETLPAFDRPACLNVTGSDDPADLVPNYRDPFFIVESVCVAWFTVEFILRLVSCPSKFAFCKDIMNIFDVLAILPFFIVLVVQVRSSSLRLAAWRSGNGVGRINEVTLRRARLVLGWVTCPGSTPEGGIFFGM